MDTVVVNRLYMTKQKKHKLKLFEEVNSIINIIIVAVGKNVWYMLEVDGKYWNTYCAYSSEFIIQ